MATSVHVDPSTENEDPVGIDTVGTKVITLVPPSSSASNFASFIDVYFSLFLFPFILLCCILLLRVYFAVYATITITGKNATMPTLVSLADSLPQFQHPFIVTSVPPSPFQTEVATDEEALDKARACLMEGIYLLNEVFIRTKARSDELSKCQVDFNEALRELKQLWVLPE
ncbi:unnamed protein product [Lactuca virosa]|uniref:Mediator of RNA polymerase II transcription subunit 21 n=1 Tax=Lactuca virosa TaxID=75947 RepID=A0AAU9PIR6_9ASTR|nr:unnamed protein product [Lactuca virosa]